MKKNRFCLCALLSISFLLLLVGCREASQDEDDTIKRLEANSKLLEVNGKIKTFPLTVVISDKLTGEAFPDEIQSLCALSADACKILPIAGILRLGPNNYYTYNNIADLKIPGSTEKNEAALTVSVEEQTNSYLSSTRLKNYDSLITPNHADWNLKDLSLTYINNTADSIFFFSQNPGSQGWMQVGVKKYTIYTDVNELRRTINQLICTSHPTISIFYNFLSLDSSGSKATAKPGLPAKGMYAGDTCIGFSKYEKLHDGRGKYIPGALKEANSTSCGFTFPTGRAGDTCVSGSKFQRLHDGKGSFMVGSLIERNSKDCGFAYPTGVAGDTCVSGSKYQKIHNGRGGFLVGKLMERNSTDCGFVAPVKLAPAKEVPPKIAPAKEVPPQVAAPVKENAAKGTAAPGFTCYKGSKYAKLHDGKGGFIRGALVEENSDDCSVEKPDNRCARRSEPLCEQEAGGGFTGRRVQYCYNKSGQIIQTIVISRCESDCRCIGR